MILNVSNHKASLLVDHFFDQQVHSNPFVNNKPIFDRNFTFNDHVSHFSTGGQDGYMHTSIMHPLFLHDTHTLK